MLPQSSNPRSPNVASRHRCAIAAHLSERRVRTCRFSSNTKDYRLEFTKEPMDRYWIRQLESLIIY